MKCVSLILHIHLVPGIPSCAGDTPQSSAGAGKEGARGEVCGHCRSSGALEQAALPAPVGSGSLKPSGPEQRGQEAICLSDAHMEHRGVGSRHCWPSLIPAFLPRWGLSWGCSARDALLNLPQLLLPVLLEADVRFQPCRGVLEVVGT